jgi:ABC-type lipoprotein release transport system permease subunit
MSALLAGLDPLDAPAFLAAAALVTLMTIGGSLLPAWRAVRVNPMTVMRTE